MMRRGRALLAPVAVLALAAAGLSTALAQPIHFERFTDDERIGCKPEYSFAPILFLPDSRGYLWFTNQTSLVRYDGYEARVYRHDAEDSTSINPSQIYALYEDRSGRLWLGYYWLWGGIDRFDPATGQFTRIFRKWDDDNYDPPRFNITAIVEDTLGNMWFGTEYAGLGRIDSTLAVSYEIPDPDDPGSISGYAVPDPLVVDRRGNVWLRAANHPTYSPYLNRRDPGSGTFTHYRHDEADPNSLIDDVVNTVSVDGRGRIWVGTRGDGLHRYDPAQDSFERYTFDPNAPASPHCPRLGNGDTPPDWGVSAILEDAYGRLWVGSNGAGLDVFDPAIGAHYHFEHDSNDPYSLGSNTISGLWKSVDGLVWVRTGDGVLYKAHPFGRRFENIPIELDMRMVETKAVFEDRSGTLWAGGFGFITRMDEHSRRMRQLAIRQAGSPPQMWANVADINQTSSGDVIVLNSGPGWSSILRYDRRDDLFEVVTDLGPDVWLTDIDQDPSGDFWAGSIYEGVFRLGADFTTKRVYKANRDDPHALPFPWAPTVELDPLGNLWVGASGGVFRHRPETDDFERVLTTDWSAFTSVHVDRSGRVWAAAVTDGLFVYDPRSKEARHYKAEAGLLSERGGGVLEDELGYIWISSDAGLSRLDPQTSAFRHFTTEDGILGGNYGFPGHVSLLPETKGDLYFPGMGGVTIVHPRNFEGNPHSPRILLDEIRLHGVPLRPDPRGPLKEPLWGADELVLKHHQNELTFSYVALHFARPSRNLYAYKMENLDEDWVQAGTQRTARYADLRPGRYVFRVKAANSDGVWNEEGVSIGVIVKPPWWATWWAYGGYVLCFGGTLFGGYRRRTRRLRERARELERQVTQRTRELAEEKRTVEQQAERLAQLEQTKDRFFANLSHEFRTPLTLILGPLQDVLDHRHGPLGPELARQLQVVRRSGRRMQRLIDQLLDLTRLEVGRLSLRPRAIEVVSFVRDIVLSFAALAERKAVTLSYRSEVDRLEAALDPDKVEKVVANLVSNAIKFTGDHGRVGVHLTPVEDPSDQVEIVVRDSGRGIPREELPLVFDRFYQASNTGDTGEVGTGIGLALARELVVLHGGTIAVESEVGWGSAFTVRLPLDLKPLEQTNGSEEEAGTGTPFEVSSYSALAGEFDEWGDGYHPDSDVPLLDATVLVVDDNEDLRRYLRVHLERLCRVEEAVDGLEGLEKARALQPDLVLADVMMPRMDGLALCRAVKEDPELAHVPVVILTARATEEAKIEGLRAGADDYLYKPFSAEELEVRVENLIVIRRKLAERLGRAVVLKPSEVLVESEDADFLEQLRRTVEEHLSEEHFTVDYLAGELATSPRNLLRRLKRLTHLSPSGFVRMMRMERAAQLLRSGRRSIARVAREVGYSDPAHFSRLFHQNFGVTPSEFARGEDGGQG